MNYNCKPSPKYILHLYWVPSKSEWRACFDFGDFNGGQLYILGAVYCKELPTKIIEQNQQQTNRKSVPCIRRDMGSTTRNVRKSRNDIILLSSYRYRPAQCNIL